MQIFVLLLLPFFLLPFVVPTPSYIGAFASYWFMRMSGILRKRTERTSSSVDNDADTEDVETEPKETKEPGDRTMARGEMMHIASRTCNLVFDNGDTVAVNSRSHN